MAASFPSMIQGLLTGLFSATQQHVHAGNRMSRRGQSSSSRGSSMVLTVR